MSLSLSHGVSIFAQQGPHTVRECTVILVWPLLAAGCNFLQRCINYCFN